MEIVLLVVFAYIAGGFFTKRKLEKENKPAYHQGYYRNNNRQYRSPTQSFPKNIPMRIEGGFSTESTPDSNTYSKFNEEKEITLNEEQQHLFNLIESSDTNFLITGKAGTGKSHLIQYIKRNLKKRLIITAPTGMAAINIDGKTINSVFQLPFGPISVESLPDLRLSKNSADILRNIDTLIVDEVSMVRSDVMEAMDWVLKAVRRNVEPFGGVQVILFGDPYQLPPVTTDREIIRYLIDMIGGIHFFDSYAYRSASFDMFELSTVIRHDDEYFIELLDRVRHGDTSADLLEKLNERSSILIPEKEILTITTNNRVATSINKGRLDELPGRTSVYKADISGKMEKSSFPADDLLFLKEGAQVVFLKNDSRDRWVNGTIGIVAALHSEHIDVLIGGIPFAVSREEWTQKRYHYNQNEQKIEEVVIASFIQYPLRLAWAITIHKSQGQTYSSVVVNLDGGAFASGQAYVALSRCKTFENLFLTRPIQRGDIKFDPLVDAFMKQASIIPISSLNL